MKKYILILLTQINILNTCIAQQKLVEYKFDFGSGPTEEGYIPINSLTKYEENQHYGFDYGSLPISQSRKGKNKLTTDFCTSNSPLFFSVKLPEGNYMVTIILGDDWLPSNTTIKAETRRLIAKNIYTPAGVHKKIKFLVNLRDSLIENDKYVKLKPEEHHMLDWDNKLTLEFSGRRPCIDAIIIKKDASHPTIFLTGNSTVTDQQLEPWASWGQMIPYFLYSNKIAVANYAVSGSTLKSFVAQRRLDKIMHEIKPGDYLFVEFAHNDQKPGADHVEPYTTYNHYLKLFIDSAREHGAIPVLVTSTCREFFDNDNHVKNTLGEYPDAMRYEAKKENVELIDLNKMTMKLYQKLGEIESSNLFVQYPAGSFPNQHKELDDHTHFNDFGAFELAKCVAWYILHNHLSLSKYIDQSKINNFNPSNPDDYKKWNLPLTPMFSEIKPAGN